MKTIHFLSQFKTFRHGFKSAAMGVCFCKKIIVVVVVVFIYLFILLVGCSFCHLSSPSKAQLLMVRLCGGDVLYHSLSEQDFDENYIFSEPFQNFQTCFQVCSFRCPFCEHFFNFSVGCSFFYLSSPSKGQVLIVGYVALMLFITVCLSNL